MQLDDLEVRFRRSSGNLPAPAALPPPVAAAPPAMPVPPMSAPMGGGDDAVMYSTDDEDVSFSTVSVLSQKVGVFRRCRYVGTKQVGKSPMITEGTGVKTGQPMGYVEQLGTFNPVEVCLVASCGAVLVHECPSCVRLSVCPSVCVSMCCSTCRLSLTHSHTKHAILALLIHAAHASPGSQHRASRNHPRPVGFAVIEELADDVSLFVLLLKLCI